MFVNDFDSYDNGETQVMPWWLHCSDRQSSAVIAETFKMDHAKGKNYVLLFEVCFQSVFFTTLINIALLLQCFKIVDLQQLLTS